MKKEKKEKKERDKSVFREYFELIVETAVFVFFVMTFIVQAFQIPIAIWICLAMRSHEIFDGKS